MMYCMAVFYTHKYSRRATSPILYKQNDNIWFNNFNYQFFD